MRETISRQCLHLCCTSKAKQARRAAPILAALHHILKLFLEPKKHITHFILLLVKEELVANSKKSHLWNMPAPDLILPGALSSQLPPTLCFLQESGLCRTGLSYSDGARFMFQLWRLYRNPITTRSIFQLSFSFCLFRFLSLQPLQTCNLFVLMLLNRSYIPKMTLPPVLPDNLVCKLKRDVTGYGVNYTSHLWASVGQCLDMAGTIPVPLSQACQVGVTCTHSHVLSYIRSWLQPVS